MIAVGFAAAPGCFFSLADPIGKTDSGVSTSGGAGGSDAGSSGTGGMSGTDGSSGGTSTGGRDASSAADADATRDAAQDSCEFPIIQDAASEDVVVARKLTPMTIDGKGDDWPSDFEWHSIAQVCSQCTKEYEILQADRFLVPQPSDLSARFRAGWDQTFLYIFVEVHDDNIVAATPATADAAVAILPNALREDAVELMIHGIGPPQSGGYGPWDFQLYFGVDETAEFPNHGSPIQSGNGNDFAVAIGSSCYSVEIKLSWAYVTADPQTSGPQGTAIGFTAAVNDWDLRPGDAGDAGATSEPESHLFSKDPGDGYWFETGGFGTLTLMQ